MASSDMNGGAGSGARAGWVGSVESIPIAEVLRRVAIEERSGDLQVSRPPATKTINFDQGFVVFASSNLKRDQLGEGMIEAGRITRHEFAQATRLMEGGKRKFGEALVQAGIVSEEELGRHVAAQVNRIVLSLFSLKQGTYSFDERPCSIPLELMVSLSVFRILIDGIRRMRSKRLVITGLPPLDTKLRIVEAPPFTLDFYKLRSEERDVLRLVREGKTLREIASAVGENEGVVLRACYALIAAGVVEVVTAEARRRPRRVQEETGTFMLSEIQRKVAKRREEAVATETPSESDATGSPRVEEHAEVRVPSPPTEAEAASPFDLEREEGRRRDVSISETPQEAAATAWNLSQLALDAAKFLKLTVLEPLLGFIRRLFEREPVALELNDGVKPSVHDLPTPIRVPVPEKVPAVSQTPPEERESTEPEPAPSEAQDRVMEIIGVPSWSMKDDPSEPVDPSRDFFEDEKEEPVDNRLGVPKWSMMDDPNDRRLEPSVEALGEDPAPEQAGEGFGAPSWSMADLSRNLGGEASVSFEPEEAEVRSREPLPEIELEPAEPVALEPADQSLEFLDSYLYVESEPGMDEQPSLLRHIPVEEIKLEEVSPENEVEIEIEEQTFARLPEPAPKPPSPPVGDARRQPPEPGERPEEIAVRAVPSPRPPVSTPKEESPPQGYALQAPDEDDDREVAASPAEASAPAHRLKLKGGEERILRDVKLHFQCKDWAGAVRLLEDLVQNIPGSAFYRGLLARAMSRHPVMRDNAEKHFIEALRISPQDAQLHYWLGLYYKSFGLKARAVNEFRTTLRIDPTHKDARKQFAGGKRGEAALGNVFKKFFS